MGLIGKPICAGLVLCVYAPAHKFQIMLDYQKFEIKAKEKFEKIFGFSLRSAGVNINGKEKSFDMVNLNKRVVGDAKYYRNTKGGNMPAAKRSTANEYVWLLQKLNKNVHKFLVIGEDRKMAEKYVKDFSPWLEEVEIYFFKIGKMPERLYPR